MFTLGFRAGPGRIAFLYAAEHRTSCSTSNKLADCDQCATNTPGETSDVSSM